MRGKTLGRDGIVLALVVTAPGWLATPPRIADPGVVIVSSLPASPCEGTAAKARAACLTAARALLAR